MFFTISYDEDADTFTLIAKQRFVVMDDANSCHGDYDQPEMYVLILDYNYAPNNLGKYDRTLFVTTLMHKIQEISDEHVRCMEQLLHLHQLYKLSHSVSRDITKHKKIPTRTAEDEMDKHYNIAQTVITKLITYFDELGQQSFDLRVIKLLTFTIQNVVI